jgi:hypothetical protein
LGWIEGKNMVIERCFAEDRVGRLPELAAALVRLYDRLTVFSDEKEVMVFANSV